MCLEVILFGMQYIENVLYIFLNISIKTFLNFNSKTSVLICDVYKDYEKKQTACFLVT